MSSQRLQYYSLKCLSMLGLLVVTFTLPYLLPGPPIRLYESRFDDPKQRATGSIACAVLAAAAGAAIVRVHDVEETVQAVRVCEAVGSAEAVRTSSNPAQELTTT